jgi:hypothetical protein
MNHRELIQSGTKMHLHLFRSLPDYLQDEIIDGLDGRTLTLEKASQLARSRGSNISHQAIWKYYRAVRMERRALMVGTPASSSDHNEAGSLK